MAEPIIVFGSGGHAKVVVEAVLARSPDREIILLDDSEQSRGRTLLGIPVSGGRELLNSLRAVPVALGIGDNRARSELLRWLKEQEQPLETVVHPATTVGKSVIMGDGAFLAAGVIAIADARVGAGAIINTGATIDHDCDVGEAAHIAPGVHLCGNVRIGARTLVGVGTAIRPGISVGADVIIGAGSVVVRDINAPGTYAGNPARALNKS